MTLVVEDGTGLANAESYCSEAEAAAYFDARGKSDAWGDLEDAEANLRIATDYLTQTYRGLWGGRRLTATQALDWPRSGVEWDDSPTGFRVPSVIPAELKYACAELALKVETTPLLEDLGRETKKEKVDVIEIEYVEGSQRQPKFTSVDGWLVSLLGTGGPSFIRARRA